MPKGQSYTHSVIKNHLSRFHSLAITSSAYCKKYGISKSTFYGWLKRHPTLSKPSDFIELTSESPIVLPDLELKCGLFSLSVPATFDRSHLTSLLLSLQEVTLASSSKR